MSAWVLTSNISFSLGKDPTKQTDFFLQMKKQAQNEDLLKDIAARWQSFPPPQDCWLQNQAFSDTSQPLQDGPSYREEQGEGSSEQDCSPSPSPQAWM